MADPTREAPGGAGPSSATRADQSRPTDAGTIHSGQPEPMDTATEKTLPTVSLRPGEEASDELTFADHSMRPTPDAGEVSQALSFPPCQRERSRWRSCASTTCGSASWRRLT